MNIVFLVGNGFDLNLGMKTRYGDFYDYYLAKSPTESTTNIHQLQSNLKEDRENWSDLEEALGQYIGRIEAEEAVQIHTHLVKELAQYLLKEEDKYIIDNSHQGIFYEHLVNPENLLLPLETRDIKNFKDNWSNHNWDIKIITFNYTKSLEKLLAYENKALKIGTHGNNPSRAINVSEIEHIHGFPNNRMVLGVNDFTQIGNEKHQEVRIIRNKYIKPHCNSTYRLGHETKCVQWIGQADLFCVFGLSFGNTDKYWWEAVGKRIANENVKMIIFWNDPNSLFSGNEGPERVEREDEIKDYFLCKTGLDEIKKEKIKERIYVGYNTEFLKVKLLLKESISSKSKDKSNIPLHGIGHINLPTKTS
ncbi:MAG: bacteriophage abortive infection AbiH family protein [Alistipes sp.]|nr:bacteriophage abortive infection AbiH family protein [Alistipes sp.]